MSVDRQSDRSVMFAGDSSRVSIADAPDESAELIGGSELFGVNNIENGAGNSASSTPELVLVDQAMRDPSTSEDRLSDAIDTSASVIPITEAVTKAAFLVANWLVGQGEG